MSLRKTASIFVNQEYCTGCRICVAFCPRHVLELDQSQNHRAVHAASAVRPEDCTACRLCELYCPDFAIAIEEKDTT